MNENIYKDRINALRHEMEKEDILIYILSNSDYHLSEIPEPYFETIKYLSGFSGSEAYMVITPSNAHLWTDGRYTLQAKQQLKGTDITYHIYSDENDEIRHLIDFFAASENALVKRMHDENLSIEDLSTSNYVIGFDGRTVPYKLFSEIIKTMKIGFVSGAVTFNTDLDLIDRIWKNRPPLSSGNIFILDEEFADISIKCTLGNLRTYLSQYIDSCGMLFTAPDDIAWMYNFRGTDDKYSLTSPAYTYINKTDAYLFIDQNKLSQDQILFFRLNGVTILDYDEFYKFLESAPDINIIVDMSAVNTSVINTLEKNKFINIIDEPSIITQIKAVKSDTEIDNILKIHYNDGVAMVKFIKWIKEKAGEETINEYEASRYLDLLRFEQGALYPSFATICAYGPNGAVVHYEAEKDTCLTIKPEGFLLVDSGGQYMGGTTDITRTIPLGSLTDEMKRDYTVVLAAMLELSETVFLPGTTDAQIDMFPRQIVWRNGINYDHGTGHGVGYMLNVHEGPHSLNWKKSKPVEMTPNRIVTDEPGCYREGKYGIRHECELRVIELEDKRLYGFDIITLAPIDTSPVDKTYLEQRHIDALNRYNERVYNELAPLLDEDERKWLYNETRPI